MLAGVALVVGAIAPAHAGRDPQARSRKPNILLVLADDQRWDALGCYGNTSIRTPNLDRLARSGARFDALYAAAPVCSASRAALLTGLAPHQNGVLDNSGFGGNTTIPAGVPTIADHLNAAGYTTGFVGKAHIGDPLHWGFRDVPSAPPPAPDRDRSLTEIHVDMALDFMERNRDQTWFLWLAPLAPHAPWMDDPDHPYDLAEIAPPPGWPKGQALSRERWDQYYSTIGHLDEQVGRLLDGLERLGTGKDTFVFFVSDNGYMMKSHGLHGKSVWFEESARVCALARGPGVTPGTVVAAPIVTTDFFATALELAGAPRPDGYECVSFLPALAGKAPLRELAYAECHRPGVLNGGHWQMVYAPPWKYVMHVDRTEEHLYDLVRDPHELAPVTALPEFADVLAKMRAKHAAWSAATPPLH